MEMKFQVTGPSGQECNHPKQAADEAPRKLEGVPSRELAGEGLGATWGLHPPRVPPSPAGQV